MNTIYINNGTFHMETCPELLPEFPMLNIHKIFRLVFAARSENADAIADIQDWIPQALQETEGKLISARAEYTAGHRDIPSYGYSDQRKKNRKLTAAVKTAKADYNKMLKIKNAFEKEKKSYVSKRRNEGSDRRSPAVLRKPHAAPHPAERRGSQIQCGFADPENRHQDKI